MSWRERGEYEKGVLCTLTVIFFGEGGVSILSCREIHRKVTDPTDEEKQRVQT